VLNGQHDEAAPHLELALEFAEALDLPEVFAQALTSKSLLLAGRNRLEESRIALEGSLAHALANDLPAAALRAFNNLAVVFESRDRYAEAVELTDRALDLARRVGDRVWESTFVAGPISGLALLGRWEEAFARAAEGETLPNYGQIEELFAFLVGIECWRGRAREARARLDGFAAIRESEFSQARASYVLHEAMVLRAEGDPQAALAALQFPLSLRDEVGVALIPVKLSFVEALEAAFHLGDAAKLDELLGTIERLHPGERPPLLTAHAARFRAKLAADPADAEAGFRRAENLFREFDLVFWLAVTQLERGEWLAGQGRADEAEPLVAEARETFERLDATPWLERAAQLASAPQETAEAVSG
jgi:tetratricopeptide (TPR) repeat protein